jgi:tRNA modification GTPase
MTPQHNTTHLNDTICAVSSPVGEGGIGVVRLSGPGSHALLRAVFRPRKRVRAFASHRLCLGFIFDPDTKTDVDEVFAVFMRPPRTYTREEMAEVYTHGGQAAQRAVLSLLTARGARLAEAGEFTRRAFENGRIDLAQAESVLDIIQSETAEELACALGHVKGALSGRLSAAKGAITGLLAEVEAEIDFPDEELDEAALQAGVASAAPTSTPASRAMRIEAVRRDIAALAATYDEGRALTRGVDVLIAGRRNVGKSSLLNALVGSDRAIVTPVPGTTRDLVEDTLRINGVKFVLTDTAGLGAPADAIEREGMERVIRKMPEADVVLWVLEASCPYTNDDEEVWRAAGGKTVIAVLNKSDLPQAAGAGGPAAEVAAKNLRAVATCALDGSGTDALKGALYDVFAGRGHKGATLLVTNVRHLGALLATEAALARASACADREDRAELCAFELRDALFHLGAITGETAAEEVLAEIFSRFCIGK